MKRSEKTGKLLRTYILFVCLSTFILIIAGGLVTSTQSGLSVPDWPNTYGHFMFAFPLNQMVGGIVFEHTHRMIASVVGLLTVILAIWMWRTESRRWVRNLALAALGAVIAQGVLGGLTVLFLLPTALSVAHATLAQSYFAMVVLIAMATSRWWHSAGRPAILTAPRRPVTGLAIVTTSAILIQLIIGAWMRHSDAGLAVPDFPLAYGQIIPSLGQSDLERYTSILIKSDIRTVADGQILPSQIIIHLLHRYWAIVVSILVVWLSVRLHSFPDTTGLLRRFSFLLPFLLVVQAVLGAYTVLSQKAVMITTTHVVTGALLLVASAAASSALLRLTGIQEVKTVPVPQPAGAAA